MCFCLHTALLLAPLCRALCPLFGQLSSHPAARPCLLFDMGVPPIPLLPMERGGRTDPKTIPWGCAGPSFTACSLLEMQLLWTWQGWSSQERLNTEQGNTEKCWQERPNIAGEGEIGRDAHSSWEEEMSTSKEHSSSRAGGCTAHCACRRRHTQKIHL